MKKPKAKKRAKPHGRDEREPNPAPSFAFGAPALPLSELDVIVRDVDAMVRSLPPSPEVELLRVLAAQSRAAIRACARDPFAGALRSALTAKVLDLESEALVAQRVERQRRQVMGPVGPQSRST